MLELEPGRLFILKLRRGRQFKYKFPGGYSSTLGIEKFARFLISLNSLIVQIYPRKWSICAGLFTKKMEIRQI